MGKTLQADSIYNQFDADGDGVVTDEEMAHAARMMELHNQQVMFENEDKKQDAQRNMAWFALFGMLLYPFAVVLAVALHLDGGAKILGDMAATYFVSVAAIVAAFYGKEALAARSASSSSSTPSAPSMPAPRPVAPAAPAAAPVVKAPTVAKPVIKKPS